MKDIYFRDNKNRKKANQNTGEIPLSEIERRMQEELKRKRYEQIVRRQQQDDPYSLEPYSDNPYQPYGGRNTQPQRTVYQPNRGEQYYIDDGYSQQNPPVRPKPTPKTSQSGKKKKSGCGCGSLLICFILIIAILFGGVFGYGLLMCSKTNYEKTPWHSTPSDVMSDPQVYNILLIGSDKESGGASRSDSMILVSVDAKNSKLKFTSFMRDSWVTVPGYGDSRLNAAFAHGGAPLLMETIESTFKVKIDNYVTVDFEMFKALIDGLGGVEIDITEEEADFINRTSHAKVHSGVNTLDGDYALIYSRIRKLDSDFNRTQRQRKVMTAIFDKARQNPATLLTSAGKVLPNITTDISPFKMMLKAFGAVKFLSYGNDQLRIPVDGEYADRTIDGQAVLVIDFYANIRAVQNFIYGRTDF